MAKNKDAAKEGQQEGKAAEPKKKAEGGGSKTFVMMFSVAMIVQLVIIVILVYFVLTKSNAPQAASQPAVAEKSAEKSEGETEGEDGEGKDEGSKKEDGPVFIYQTEDLVVNPKGSGGRRYLMTQIGLSVPSEEVKKEFEESRKAQIYDILNQFLASRSIDDLADIDKRDSLKIDLKKTLNKEISGKKIKNVFFSKFVVQ